MDLVQLIKILAIFPTAEEHPRTKTFFIFHAPNHSRKTHQRRKDEFFRGNILTLLVPAHEYFSSQLGATNSFHKHQVSSNPELPVSVLNEKERECVPQALLVGEGG